MTTTSTHEGSTAPPTTMHADTVHAARTDDAGSTRAQNVSTSSVHAQDVPDVSTTWGARPARRAVRVVVMGKGGATKTTTTASLGDALASLTGWGVLLIDLDAQPSLSRWLAPDTDATVVEALQGSVDARDITLELRPGLTMLPAHDGLADLRGQDLSVPRLHAVIHDVQAAFEVGVVLIDTPPAQPVTSSSLLLATALAAADVVVIPYALGRKATDAMRMVLADVRTVRPGVPVMLLPANVPSAVNTQAAVELARALRPDLTFAEPVQWVRDTVRRAEDRGKLLATDSPRSPAVAQYAAAAGVLAPLVATVGARL